MSVTLRSSSTPTPSSPASSAPPSPSSTSTASAPAQIYNAPAEVSRAGDSGDFDINTFMADVSQAPDTDIPKQEPISRPASAVPPQPKPDEGDHEQEQVAEQSEQVSDSGETAQQPETVQPAAEEGQKLPTRPYDEFPAEIRPHLRKMSSKAFALFRQAYNDNRELTKKVAEFEQQSQELANARWYTSENAWQLHPEVTQYTADIDNLSQEQAHYQEQYVLAAEGKPWKHIAGYDKDGNPVLQDMQGGPRAQLMIQQLLGKAQNMIGERQGKIQNLKQTFANQAQQVTSAVKELNETFFPTVKGAAVDKKINEILAPLPSHMRSWPEYQLAAKAILVANFVINSQGKTATQAAANGRALKAASQNGKVIVAQSAPRNGKQPAQEISNDLMNTFEAMGG